MVCQPDGRQFRLISPLRNENATLNKVAIFWYGCDGKDSVVMPPVPVFMVRIMMAVMVAMLPASMMAMMAVMR